MPAVTSVAPATAVEPALEPTPGLVKATTPVSAATGLAIATRVALIALGTAAEPPARLAGLLGKSIGTVFVSRFIISVH